jgi:hypothetical protein
MAMDLSSAADVNDNGRLRRKWLDKRKNAKKNGNAFLLSFEEYADLLREAGIVSSTVGPSGYHLARYGDKGPYAIGNCRFVPYIVNARERVVDGGAVSRGLIAYYATHPGSFTGISHKDSTKALIGAANCVSQAGARNSQFGRAWITDGKVNKKIDTSELSFYLDAGWRRGRTLPSSIG